MEQIKSREDKMKERNTRQKNLAKMIGQNLSLYICIMIPVILIGLIWTDSSLPKLGWGLLGDAILTVALLIIGERSMINVGVNGGKLDDEYLETLSRFREIVANVKKIGVLMLDPFCDWQIDLELRRAKQTRCRRIGIKFHDYQEKYEGKPFDELVKMVGAEKAAQIQDINNLKPIDLNPDLLLTEGVGKCDRRDIPEGAWEYIQKKKYGKIGIAISVATAVFTVTIALTLTKDVTIARVIYTAVKLTALLYRMTNGYNNGAKAYNMKEVAHLNAKIEYLSEYEEFMEKKLYLTIAEDYPQVKQIACGEFNDKGVENEIQSKQFFQEATEQGYGGGKFDDLAMQDYSGA